MSEVLLTYRKIYIDLIQILEDLKIDLQKSMINVADVEDLWNERLQEIEKNNDDTADMEDLPMYGFVSMTYKQKEAVVRNEPDPMNPVLRELSYVEKKVPKNIYESIFLKEFTTNEEKKELEKETKVIEEIVALEEMIDRVDQAILFYEDIIEKYNVYDSENVENTKNEKELKHMKEMFPDVDIPDPTFVYMAKNKE